MAAAAGRMWPSRRRRGRVTILAVACVSTTAALAGTASADTTFLGSRTQLNPGQMVASPKSGYVLAMQQDGNLVMIAPGNRPVWSSGTRVPNTVLQVQQDGNVVLYAPGHKQVWSTGTNGKWNAVLAVQDDGNLVVVAPGNQPVWASGSGGRLGQTVSPAGVAFIRSLEATRLTAYNDGARGSGNCTIGVGHLLQYGPCTGFNVGLSWTSAQVDAQLSADLARFVGAVGSAYGAVGIAQNQFDALVSFAFNAGTGPLANTSLKAAVLAHDSDRVAAVLRKYVKARNAQGQLVTSAGLCNRRRSEVNLWRTGVYVRLSGGCTW